jgi:tetratricopeptide (TPR) repeat protein
MNASTPPLQDRPPRDPRFQPYLDNQAMWGVMYALIGIPHAGSEPNPRPLPRTTLYDFKRRLAAGAPTGTGPIPDALHFAFYPDSYTVPPEKGILIHREHFWWLATSQDPVLLSDRITHHYTEISKIDRVNERVSLYEYWPEDFFLLPGRNAFGIEARSDPGLSVSKAEFLRAIAGLVTWDRPQLVAAYFAAFPEKRHDHDPLLRFGYALMDAEADELASWAADLFAEAVRLAGKAGDNERAEMAGRQAYLAATCGFYFASSRKDEATARLMHAILQAVTPVYGETRLQAGLQPPELARLANAAGQARDFKRVRAVLDLAIGKDPDFEDGFWLRAGARLQEGDSSAAAKDAERALALNQVELKRLADQRFAIDSRGKWELIWKDAQIGGRRQRRESELATLIQARMQLQEFDQAREAARELIELQPDQPLGYLKRAALERAAGRAGEAATALRAAIERERDVGRRASYERLLAELEHAKQPA